MRDWVSFWDSDHSIYVNARHRDVHYRTIADMIVRHVPSPDATVLDFGCGEALHADRVAAACRHLILVDAAPNVRASLRGPKGVIRRLAFSPAGKLLAGAGLLIAACSSGSPAPTTPAASHSAAKASAAAVRAQLHISPGDGHSNVNPSKGIEVTSASGKIVDDEFPGVSQRWQRVAVFVNAQQEQRRIERDKEA